MGKQRTAEEYMAYWRTHETWTHLTRPKHIERLHTCADWIVGDTFVDVGCALGHSTGIMKTRKAGDWTGVDFDPTIVPEAGKLFPDIKFVYASSMENLGTLGKWDGVVCSEVIEHVPDPKALVDALLCITGKRLIISTPSIYVNDIGHVRLYTMVALMDFMHGFDTVHSFRIDEIHNFFYVRVEVKA